jgi:myo-inositol catabolism protein IolH
VHQHLNIGEGDVDFDALFRQLKAMDFGKKDDTIAAVSLFGFPEKIESHATSILERIKRELL